MKKSLIITIVFLVVVVTFYFIFSKNVSDPTNIQKVTVSQAFDMFLYAPLYIAQERGYFGDQGLDVEIITAGGDEKAFASLVSGDAQFAVGDPTFVAIAGEKGQPGKVVGALLNGVPFWGITDTPDISTIEDPSELATYSVATFPAPSTAYTLQKEMFESAGLRPNIQEIAPGGLIPALRGGSVDIALELEPNVSIAVSNGSRVIYSLSKYYPDFAITGITVLPRYAEENDDTIQKFVNAVQKAHTYIRSNPEDSATIVATRFPEVPTDVAINALMNVVYANVVPENLITSESGWNTAIQLRRDAGDLAEDAPFATYVDNSFAENAR